jgi:hypothetical protein
MLERMPFSSKGTNNTENDWTQVKWNTNYRKTRYLHEGLQLKALSIMGGGCFCNSLFTHDTWLHMVFNYTKTHLAFVYVRLWVGRTNPTREVGGRVEQSELPFISIRFWLQNRCCFHFRELAVFTSVKWFCGFSEVVLRCQTRIFSQFLNICVLQSHFTEVVRGGIVHWIFVCSSSIYCMRFSAVIV